MTATVSTFPIVPRTNPDTAYRVNGVQLKRREDSALIRLARKWGMSLEDAAAALIERALEGAR